MKEEYKEEMKDKKTLISHLGMPNLNNNSKMHQRMKIILKSNYLSQGFKCRGTGSYQELAGTMCAVPCVLVTKIPMC